MLFSNFIKIICRIVLFNFFFYCGHFVLGFHTTAKNNNTPERHFYLNSFFLKNPPEFYQLFLKGRQEDVSDTFNQQGH